MKESDTSPFAMATFFKADTRFPVTQSRDYNSLGNFINGHLATRNVPYAIKIKGRFGYIKIRSVPVQNKPYPVLAEVIKRQSIFEFRDIEGTLVGFRMPDYAQGINIAGYHLHFLSQDRSKGGHLLECAIDNAVVEVDLLNRIVVNLPESRNFYSLDFSSGASESSTAENGR
jgi:acetolactate decarboxylase